MSAKVKQDARGAWWVVAHFDGRRKKRRFGPSRSDKKAAADFARDVNRARAAGTFGLQKGRAPLACDIALRGWLRAYAPTMKPTYRVLAEGIIENHLAPHFGGRDLRELREADILAYIQVKLAGGMAPKTAKNGVSILRRVLNLLEREGAIDRNPARGIGDLIRRVAQASATETEEVEHWSREEAAALLETALNTEPRFAPFLAALFATGMRRGECMGLKWADVDFDGAFLSIRRAVTSQGLSTPKSGKARRVPVTPTLAETLFDLLAERRREALRRGWAEIPEWVFCSETGTCLEPRNVERVWQRVRRRAQKCGIRPLKLHSTRHSWASWALEAGKSVRWVADVLGHADPSLTLRVYAHAMREAESDLSFADLGGLRRPYTAPRDTDGESDARNVADSMARREGFEPPTLRFEA
jgi:integrase